MREGRRPEAERTLYELWGMQPLAQAAVEEGEIDYAERCAIALLRVPKVAASATRNSVIRDDRSHEYEAHVILGKVALSRGDVDAAERHLLEAGGVDAPSSARRTLGPDTDLAARLLEDGRSGAVAAYLAGCREFWHPGQAQIDAWLIDLRNDRRPDLSDRSLVSLTWWWRRRRA